MSVVKKAYEELPPKGASLADVVVLAQAWKKSHAFIRRHNWYADVLELDASTIDLESRLAHWAQEVSADEFAPEPLLLVPAPKNARWEFPAPPNIQTVGDFLDVDIESLGSEPAFGDWRPRETSETNENGEDITQKLRPLAHLAIRDQTLATAVMMCLAGVVETAQGDPSDTDVMRGRERGVVSYGNRLHCLWEHRPQGKSVARFSWGNSRTYRQYFQDYRAFLARPRLVCAELLPQTRRGCELFVVSFDVKAFFDSIDRKVLAAELKRLEAEHRVTLGLPAGLAADEEFWQLTDRIFQWRWRQEEHENAALIAGEGNERLELGLPQGLVAAGFLANAYLIEFDRDLQRGARAAQSVADEVRLLDYCRYVDDMRLVVEVRSGRGGLGQEEVRKQVERFVKDALERHCRRLGAERMLDLSRGKTVITPYRSISAQSNISALMAVLNAELSGTFDLESLVQAAGGLDGLLSISDEIDEAEAPKPSRLSLATVSVPAADVRDDTVKRFVATRLVQVLRHRLAMTDTDAPIDTTAADEQVTKGMVLAHEFESTARKLIKCWAENPSLALLLRCGLDLFPHPKLLAPVVEALNVKLFPQRDRSDIDSLRQVKMAEYVLADLFRAGAVETGYREPEDYPDGVDVDGYREELGAVARLIVMERRTSPWYLLQQAHLFLASIADVSLAGTSGEMPAVVQPYRDLLRAMVYEPAHGDGLQRILPLALVGQQLQPNPRRFGKWLAEGLRRTPDETLQAHVVRTVSLNRPDLLIAAISGRPGKAPRWRSFAPRALLETRKSSARRTSSGPATRPLLALMRQADNPFSQENGVLMLAKALLSREGIEANLAAGLSAADILLSCSDWTRLHALPESDAFLVAELQPSGEEMNPLYRNPPWVDEDQAWLYGLGRVLRSAVTGEFDFTSRHYLVTEEVGRYTGLRSTWFKRRFGLLNAGKGLVDEPAPVSPWLSGLLSTLLRWPGVEFRANDAAKAGDARTREELLAVIEERISYQRMLYGPRSKSPMYVIPTHDQMELENRSIRIAIVQPMRPRRDEFDAKDPTHWTPGVLAEHRRHLAEVCRLTRQKLQTWSSARSHSDADRTGPVVDVILFPECVFRRS